MNRRLFITIHLYLSSFLAANVVAVAISGGLYLLGSKGEVTTELAATLAAGQYQIPDAADRSTVAELLKAAGISDYDFEYVVQSQTRVTTRPTSRDYYTLQNTADGVAVTRVEPDLVKRVVELHKGHGPGWFKTYSKVFAAGLLFVILSGLWLGLTSPVLRTKTLVCFSSGLVLFFALASL